MVKYLGSNDHECLFGLGVKQLHNMKNVKVLFKIRGMAEKFVDTISIFNRKRNLVKMNISGFAKIFHEQIDEIL